MVLGWRSLAMAMLAACVGPEPGVPAADELPEGFEAGAAVVCPAPVDGMARFADETVARGIELSVARPAGMEDTELGGAVVVHDLDADGDPDLLVWTGGASPALFVHDGTGAFRRGADPVSGLDGLRVAAMGAVDLDGDALPELLLAGWDFVAVAWNLGDLAWSPAERIVDAPGTSFSSLSWGDIDGDGDLDLYVSGLDLLGDPEGATVAYDRLIFQDGDRFTVVPSPQDGPPVLSFLSAILDVDGDGDQDVAAFADRPEEGARAVLLVNEGIDGLGRPLLVDRAHELGFDTPIAPMGIGSNDLDQDGRLDRCVSDAAPVVHCFVASSQGSFFDQGAARGLTVDLAQHPGLSEADRAHWTGWSVELTDFDNDGHPDLFAAAAPVPNEGRGVLAHPDALWRGLAGGRFEEASLEAGVGSPDRHYGAVSADLDGDGYRDLVLGSDAGSPTVLGNACGAGAWLAVELVGPPGNSEGYGAKVAVDTGDRVDLQEMVGSRGVGQGPSVVHVGAGDRSRVRAVTVTWPDGLVMVATDVPTRRTLTVVHPAAR